MAERQFQIGDHAWLVSTTPDNPVLADEGPLRSSSAAVTVGGASSSASATASSGYSATTAVTAGTTAASASATATVPVSTATAAASTGGAVGASAGTVTAPATRSGSAALTSGGTISSATASAPPARTATAALTIPGTTSTATGSGPPIVVPPPQDDTRHATLAEPRGGYLRSMYEMFAVPQLFESFCDEHVLLRYTFGDVQKECRCIQRDIRVEVVPDESGILEKRTVCQVLVSVDEDFVLGGIEQPQFKSLITIVDPYGRESKWSIDSAGGSAIESITNSLATINLVQTRAAAYSSANYRR